MELVGKSISEVKSINLTGRFEVGVHCTDSLSQMPQLSSKAGQVDFAFFSLITEKAFKKSLLKFTYFGQREDYRSFERS